MLFVPPELQPGYALMPIVLPSSPTIGNTVLGVVLHPNDDVKNGELTLNGNFYEKYARMHRALINWRNGVNGKIDITVSEENKEWLLALNEETNELIRYFDYVFGE